MQTLVNVYSVIFFSAALETISRRDSASLHHRVDPTRVNSIFSLDTTYNAAETSCSPVDCV